MARHDKFEILSDEQIKMWRERWKQFPDLADELADILRNNPNGKPSPPKRDYGNEETGEILEWDLAEIRRRLVTANRRLAMENVKWSEENYGKPAPFDVELDESKWPILDDDLPDKRKRVPILDLRGILWQMLILNHLSLPFVDFSGAHFFSTSFDGTDFHHSKFQKSSFSLGSLRGTNFYKANLFGAQLSHINMHGSTLKYSDLRGVDFSWVGIHGSKFDKAIVHGATFAHAKTGVWRPGKEFRFHKREGRKTEFANNEFVPSKSEQISTWRNASTNPREPLGHIRERYLTLRSVWLTHWFYTDFTGMNISEDNVDFSLAPDLQRYIKDQQYLVRLRNKASKSSWMNFWHSIWRITSNYGYSVGRIAGWATLLVVLFAFIYALMPFPAMPEAVHQFLMTHSMEWVVKFLEVPDKLLATKLPDKLLPPIAWLFISFDAFTNLGLRPAEPASNIGALLVLLENLFGYVTLGLLISVFANRFARRAA